MRSGGRRGRKGRNVRLAATLAVLLIATTATPADAAEADPAAGATVDRILRDPAITESSGLAASTRHPGVLWTVNDSGSEPRLYAVGRNGRTAATHRVEGVQARDWEALAPGRDEEGRPVLWVGDIGDNSSARSRGILVHRVPEPARLDGAPLTPTSYRLRYPDGPHDAEALLVHPGSGRLYVVTKQVFAGAVYAAPHPLRAGAVNRLQRVGRAPGIVTDGAFLPDGRVVLRDYSSAVVFPSVRDKDGQRLALPAQEQGETLAALGSGAVLVGSEGAGSEVWRVPVPPGSASAGEEAEGADMGAGVSQGLDLPPRRVMALLLVLAAAGVAALAGQRGLRRRLLRFSGLPRLRGLSRRR